MECRTKFFFQLFIIFIWALWSIGTFSQKVPPKELWLDKLMAIEKIDSRMVAKKINLLEELLASYEEHTSQKDSVYARMVHRLGDLHRQLGDLKKAMDLTQIAISINRPQQPLSEEAYLSHSYYNLGLDYASHNLFKQSLLYLDSAIEISNRFPEKKFIYALAHEQKAFYYFSIGEFQRSIETSDYGLITTKELRGTQYEALLLIQKAQAQLGLNLLSQAEVNISKAIKILLSPNMPIKSLAVGYSVNAFLLKKKKEFSESKKFFEKAFQINLESNNVSQSVKDLSDLGLLYHKDFNDPEKALNCYFRCTGLIKHLKDHTQLALIYNNIGKVYLDQKDNYNAIHYFQKGLNELPLGFTDTLWHSNPSSQQIKLVNNDQILTALLANKGTSLLEIYKQKQGMNYLIQALYTFKMGDYAIDQMRWKQNTVQSKLFWREKSKKMYEQAIEVSYLLKDLESGFYFMEKSRAVMLSDKLNELGANKFLSPTDQENENNLQLQLLFSLQKLSMLVDTDEEYEKTTLDWFNAQASYEKFIKSLENKYPTYYQYKYDTIHPTINEVRERLLTDNQSLVEYFNGDSAIYILAVLPDTTIFTRSNYKDYRTSANELLSLTSNKLLLNRSYSRYQQLAYEFYETLFKPLSIPTKRVIISPDDQFVPFEILLTDLDNPSSFLLRDHAFSYTYSADYMMKNIHDQFDASNSVLGVAPVDYHPSLQLQSLEGSDLSLQNIGANLPSSKLLMNENATKKQFLDHLPLYSIVHLYSHADADSIGSEPVIYLQDSVLGVSELQTLGDLSTRLIVLSACKTGIGKNIRGEGVFSLSRGFAAAGIPSSVTTLWQIDNEPTYQVTELFFEYVSKGLPLDEALQKAKLDFLDNNDITYELPYFWAANILVGKTDKINQEAHSPTFFPFIIIGAFLLLISSFFYVRRRSAT